MTTYLRHEHPIAHFRRSEAALAGIPYLTLDDMLALMGAEVDLCDEFDREMARRDLRANGYVEQYISLWSCRPIVKRWVEMARDREWCRQNMPDGENTRWKPVTE